MKVILKLLAALCLIGFTSSIVLAAAETVDLGPVKLSLELQDIGPYNVEKENPSSLSYNSGGNTFAYQYFPASIKATNTGNRVLLEVHQTSAAQSLDASIPQYNNTTGLEHLVEISDMMPSGKDVQRQTYYVDGHKGIAFIVNRSQKSPIYLAAFSPDLKDGSGKTLVIIGSEFPLNTTKSIFESVKTQLVQDNTVSQGNVVQSSSSQGSTVQGSTSQSNVGMANMGQSNMAQGNVAQSSMGQSNAGMSNMGQSNMGQANMGMGMGMMNNMMVMMNNMMGMMNNMMGMGSMGQGNMGQGNSMGQGGMMM